MFFFFKQKTAYEMRISDWSSDVCSSDLRTFAQECSDASRSPRNRRTADAARRIAECRNPRPPRARRARMKVVDNVARAFAPAGVGNIRSEERRVGEGCVRTGKSRGSPYP